MILNLFAFFIFLCVAFASYNLYVYCLADIYATIKNKDLDRTWAFIVPISLIVAIVGSYALYHLL